MSKSSLSYSKVILRRQQGFTIIEFLIAAALIGIITSFAVPGFIGLVDTFRVDSNQRAFMSAIKFSQSEAIKRNTIVSICVADATPNTCDASDPKSWSQGWYVFTDDGDGTIETGSGEEILREHGSVAGLTFFTNPANAGLLTFAGNGSLATGSNTVFALCSIDSNNLDCTSTDPGDYHSGFQTLGSGQLVVVKP